jgi:RNA polymerase sigma factor (sigma-70 family)
MLNASELESIFDGLTGTDIDAKSSAISQIYDEFMPMLYKKMRYKFRSLSENDAEDIVQEAFLKIFTTTSKPSTPAAIGNWVITIVENTALDLFKKAYKKNELSWPTNDDQSDADFVDLGTLDNADIAIGHGQCSLSLDPLNREVEECVSQGVLEFSEKHPDRGAAISMHLDGLPVVEMATLFNRTEAAMRQFIYESKKKLAPFTQHCLGELV